MKQIDIAKFSARYSVRQLDINDTNMIYKLCLENVQYYEYSKKELSMDLIEQDLKITPPNIPLQQKYFVGFFDDNNMVAVMDLIDGYPDDSYAYIGFFMMRHSMQGAGIGSEIITEVLKYLHQQGFKRCRLGIDKYNPQSYHFWTKNGFIITREIKTDDGVFLVAEKQL